jgi:alpha-amylase/alpha-mannosidase (GH57 family)
MKSTKKYICIHGHFYQPPREHAWLEVVETQDSASPFHDWNERINFECYAPNSSARILDKDGKIESIVNNYAKISFNFGPTLLSWMEVNDPGSYKRILEADKNAQDSFGGFGSAIAQVYNHLIMPLANRQDKITQISWGIKDFEHRFERKPDGMWLAETAVDTETLEILADFGIKFTILAPRQVKAFRKKGVEEWTEGECDSRRPYKVLLPSGKEISIFIYDGDSSQSIAFKGLLNSGKSFANKLLTSFSVDTSAQLVHVATDGESYGHHHRHGEMALADCLHIIENMGGLSLTNYAQYLQLFPPEYELQIHENSSL